MIANYIKIALRNLVKHRKHSIISICGLALGLACCLSILLFIQDEFSYDRYHANSDRIFRLATEVDGASFDGIAKVNGPWGTTAALEIPEVEAMARFVINGQTLFTKDDMRFYEEDGFYVDSTVFDIFSFEVLSGNLSNALVNPNSIVLTESLAKKYFENQNAIGQSLAVEDKIVEVTAVIKDVPENSHFTFTYLLSMEGYDNPRHNHWTQWNQYYTYLLLAKSADPKLVASKFGQLLPTYIDAEEASSYHPILQPLTDIHLRSHLFREINPNSDLSLIYIFGAIGILILIISSINFINLSTARAMLRSKEVGIRKSNGASKGQLITQYLGESLLLCIVALIFAGVLLFLVLPYFNQLVDKRLHLSIENVPFIGTAFLIAILMGLVSGAYPALFLAKLKPTAILKGKVHAGRSKLREALVVFQFAISAFLIIAVSIVYRQLSFIQSKSLGFDPTALITMTIQDNALLEKASVFKETLLQQSLVVNVTISGNQPGGGDWGIPYVAENVDPEVAPPMRILAVDETFIKTFGMELAAGRDFSEAISSDSISYIINEEAAKQLGWDNPLDHRMSMPAIGRPPGNVIGVVKDFHFRSLKEKIGPIMLFMPPASWKPIVNVRIQTKNIEPALAEIEEAWSNFDPAHPFDYSFFDQTYGKLYEAEKRLGKLISLFTGIGIFIACMGLFSLAAFMIDQRTKEIGVRKILGASLQSISILLSKDLVILVLIGFVIAVPAGHYVMQEWLGDFAYRTSISPLIFVITGIGVLAVSWITISFKVIKAGLSNPINSLRVE
ncbi:MAG: ABC transporter permease [Cyclobacteriaceae bacterium]